MRAHSPHIMLTAGLVAWLAATSTQGAQAQDAQAPADAAPAEQAIDGIGLSTGGAGTGEAAPEGTEPEVGRTYVREAFTDWELRCVRSQSGQDPCQLYQLLQDQDDNAVAEISIFDVPDGAQVAAGATIVTPLETLLTEQLSISIDGAAPKVYPFSWCSAVGCFARVGFTAAEIGAFQRGNAAQLTIVPVVAPDQQVVIDVSLSGFTAGLAAVEANQAAIAAAQPAGQGEAAAPAPAPSE